MALPFAGIAARLIEQGFAEAIVRSCQKLARLRHV
jgi:hypothetical protein